MFEINDLPKFLWPAEINNIPMPPKGLRIRGLQNFKKLLSEKYTFLTVVGSRNFTEYGELACKKLIAELALYKICIVSGLAYGIDSLAHETAILHGLPTIAFPGSGLNDEVIYPQANFELSKRILKGGGAIISEFADDQTSRPWMFPQRNRLMVGISPAVLIIEAGEKSGSGISAHMAIDYNKELLAVPGSIFNHNSIMTNKFIKKGANLVSSGADILEILKLNDPDGASQNFSAESHINESRLNCIERNILNFIQNGLVDRDKILEEMKIPISEFNRAISKLEIMDLI